MSKKKYKYDIAISVAEEDLPAAQQIAVALRKQNISYYLYTEHRASNWGQHILKISQDAYGSEARYVLMLTSRVFVQKYWANIESQISQIFSSGKEVRILQLRLDDTQVDGLSKHRVFVDWNSNPDEIAAILKQKLQGFGLAYKPDSPGNIFRRPKWITLILISFLTVAVSGILLYRTCGHPDVPDPAQSKPYYNFNIAGNDNDLEKMIFSYLKNSVKTRGIGTTGDIKKAKKIYQLTFQVITDTDANGLINSTCTYRLSVTDAKGNALGDDSGTVAGSGTSLQNNLNQIAGQIAHGINSLL